MTRESFDDSVSDSGPVFSREAVTPRGGFMARPGMKTPPRHAVVVRVGDAPLTEHIPIARSSAPPPAPASDAAPDSLSQRSLAERETMRAVPKPSTPPPPPVAILDEPLRELPGLALPRHSERFASILPPAFAPVQSLESAPPPSDAPLVSSVGDSEGPPSRRTSGARWPIVIAAAAGLVLGLVSVATRLSSPGAAAPAPAVTLSEAPMPAVPPVPAPPAASPSASAVAAPNQPSAASVKAQKPAARPAAPLGKHSIF